MSRDRVMAEYLRSELLFNNLYSACLIDGITVAAIYAAISGRKV